MRIPTRRAPPARTICPAYGSASGPRDARASGRLLAAFARILRALLAPARVLVVTIHATARHGPRAPTRARGANRPAQPTRGKPSRLRPLVARFAPRLARDLAARLAGALAVAPPGTTRAAGALLLVAGFLVTIPAAPSPALLPKLTALLGLLLLALALLPRRGRRHDHDEAHDAQDDEHDEKGTASVSHEDHASAQPVRTTIYATPQPELCSLLPEVPKHG